MTSLSIELRYPTRPLNLEKAVGTTDDTDDTDNTDEEHVALERAFTQRVSAEEAPGLRESGYYPCHPWFHNCRI